MQTIMPRKLDPEKQYRVTIHMSNGHRYATTQPYVLDPKTGKQVRRYKSWGTVDEDKKFHPNRNFMTVKPAERRRLIFPPDWDLSEVQILAKSSPSPSPSNILGTTLMFGATWLLGEIASARGITQNLLEAFWGDEEMVNDVLTLTMYTYLTGFDWGRISAWQRVELYPSSRQLTPSVISILMDLLSEEKRDWFITQTLNGAEGQELVLLESVYDTEPVHPLVSWSTAGSNLPRKARLERLALTKDAFLPVWYQTKEVQMFGDSILDSVKDNLPFPIKQALWVVPRTMPTDFDLERFVETCTQEGVRCLIPLPMNSRYTGHIEKGLNPQTFWTEEIGQGSSTLQNNRYRLPLESMNGRDLWVNLYFDWQKNGMRLDPYMEELKREREMLRKLRDTAAIVADPAALERRFPLVHVSLTAAGDNTWRVSSFQMNQSIMADAVKKESYFAILSMTDEVSSEEALRLFQKRKSHEALLHRLRRQMSLPEGTTPQKEKLEEGDATEKREERNTEDTTNSPVREIGLPLGSAIQIQGVGASFICYLVYLIDAYLYQGWSTTALRNRFSSPQAILDEMRSILCVKNEEGFQVVSDQVGERQQAVLDAFGIRLPL